MIAQLSSKIANHTILNLVDFRQPLIINLSNCKYDSGKWNNSNSCINNSNAHIANIVRRVAKRFGMKVCNDEDADWTIYWSDTVLPEKLSEMKLYQVRTMH